RAARPRRARHQAAAVSDRAHASFAGGTRPDHHADLDAAAGLERPWRERHQGRDRRHREAQRSRLVQHLQGPACQADPGHFRRQEERSLANRVLAYLQLPTHLDPTNSPAILSLADLYEAMNKPQLAIKAYSKLPAESPLKRNAEIQMAIDLDVLEKTDEAKQHL